MTRMVSQLRGVFARACWAQACPWAATPDDCHALRKHGHRAEAQKCYESLTAARDPYLRAEGYWGTEMYQEANNQFRTRGGPVARRTPCTASVGAA